MTPARFTDLPAEPSGDRIVVVDLDGDVDAIPVPGDVAALVEQTYGETERAAVYEVIALLVARLGGDTALPAVRRWIGVEPGILRDFPAETLRRLATDPGALGPIVGRLGG